MTGLGAAWVTVNLVIWIYLSLGQHRINTDRKNKIKKTYIVEACRARRAVSLLSFGGGGSSVAEPEPVGACVKVRLPAPTPVSNR